MRPGVPWRALPERVGKGNALARRFRRWAQAGLWHKLFQALPEPEGEGVLGDSTTVKAQAAAAGQKKVRLRSRAWATAGGGGRPKSTACLTRGVTACLWT